MGGIVQIVVYNDVLYKLELVPVRKWDVSVTHHSYRHACVERPSLLVKRTTLTENKIHVTRSALLSQSIVGVPSPSSLFDQDQALPTIQDPKGTINHNTPPSLRLYDIISLTFSSFVNTINEIKRLKIRNQS